LGVDIFKHYTITCIEAAIQIEDHLNNKTASMLILNANIGQGKRIERQGLKLLRRIRSLNKFNGPVIVYSLDRRLDDPVFSYRKAHYLLYQPFSLEEFSNLFQKAKTELLSPEQLNVVIQKYCNIPKIIEDLRATIRHDFNHTLSNVKLFLDNVRPCENIKEAVSYLRKPKTNQSLKDLRIILDKNCEDKFNEIDYQLEKLEEIIGILNSGDEITEKLKGKVSQIHEQIDLLLKSIFEEVADAV